MGTQNRIQLPITRADKVTTEPGFSSSTFVFAGGGRSMVRAWVGLADGLQTVAGTALTWVNLRVMRHFGTHLTRSHGTPCTPQPAPAVRSPDTPAARAGSDAVG
jgi:hypothetical protein